MSGIQALGDGTDPDPKSPANTVWKGIYTNKTLAEFFTLPNGTAFTTAQVQVYPGGYSVTNPPVFATKVTLDNSTAIFQPNFTMGRILFATGNLTDLVVFQTTVTVRELIRSWKAICALCSPRFYPLASANYVLAQNQPMVSITAFEPGNWPGVPLYMRAAYGIHTI